MHKITVVTPIMASTGFDDSGEFIIAPMSVLNSINGFKYNSVEEVGDPMFEFFEFQKEGLTQPNSVIRITLNEDENLLLATSEFQTIYELDENEITQFMDDYEGQILDGVGSGMTQDMADQFDIEIDVYSSYDKKYASKYTQIKII